MEHTAENRPMAGYEGVEEYLTTWYRIGLTLSILGPIWLAVFGLFYGFRNFCYESCGDPVIRPDDHWTAWGGTAICVALFWTATVVLRDWRRQAAGRELSEGQIRLARWLPAIIGLGAAGAIYAIAAQSTVGSGSASWTYTGGSVWLWAFPVVGGAILAFTAARQITTPNARGLAFSLLAAIAISSGYVVVDSSSGKSIVEHGTAQPISISQPEPVVQSCSDSPDQPLCGEASYPLVVASPGTGQFTAFYSTFPPAAGLEGRSMEPGTESSPKVLATQGSAPNYVQSIGFGSEFAVIPIPDGRFALASSEFGIRADGTKEVVKNVGLTNFQVLGPDLEPSGQPQSISSPYKPAQRAPAMAADPSGRRFLIAQSSVQGEPLAVHLIDLSGRQLSQSSIPAASAYGGSAGYPVAATYDPSGGGWRVAWANARDGIFVQDLDQAGHPQGSPIHVAGDKAYPVTELRFAYNPQLRKSLLAWVTSDSSSFASKSATSGRLLGPGRSVGPLALFYSLPTPASVRVAPVGRAFLVSWLRGDGAIQAATYDPSAKQIPPSPDAGDFPLSLPDRRTVWTPPQGDDIAYLTWDLDPASESGLVAWTHDGREIRGQFVSTSP